MVDRRMLLYELSNGDKVYRYEKSIVIIFEGKRKVISTAILNGAYREDLNAVFNHDGKVSSGMPCEMLSESYPEHMRLLSIRMGLDPKKVCGMVTAADMENASIKTLKHENLTVTAIATGGIETNGGRVGDPADWFSPMEKPDKAGTINIMLVMDTDLPEGSLARALVTCTEAKTAAIQELMAGSNYSTGLATGSGTDQTIVIANSDSELYLEGAGKHSKLGELIGRTVKEAVKETLSRQSNLNPQRQHDVLRRLKRFGVTTTSLWELYLKNKNVRAEDTVMKAIGAEDCGEELLNEEGAASKEHPASTDGAASEEQPASKDGAASLEEPISQEQPASTEEMAANGKMKIMMKPVFLDEVEKLGKDKAMLTYTSLYVHLLDQLLWELIDEEEAVEAANKILAIIAETYGYKGDAITLTQGSVEEFTEKWQDLFLGLLKD